MSAMEPKAFARVPRTARGHFLLNFYAAVYRLLHHILRLSEVGGEELPEIFLKFPFLAGYFAEMREYFPDEVTWEEGLRWWEAEITAWEESCPVSLPLSTLDRHGGLSFQSRIALIIVGLVEEDSRFGTFLARLQEPLGHRRPCLELVGQMMQDGSLGEGPDPWTICRPLLAAGLVEAANGDAPRSEWVLRVPQVLWDAVKGEVASHPASWCEYFPPESYSGLDELIFPEAFLARLKQVPTLLRGGKARAVILRGMQGSDRLRVLGALARDLGQGVIVAEGAALMTAGAWRLLGPLCTLSQSLPVVSYDLGPGETLPLAPLTGYKGPLGLVLGFEGGLQGQPVEQAVTLTLPAPEAAHRRRHWQAAFADYPVHGLEEIIERFYLPEAYIRQAAATAIAYAGLGGRQQVHPADVREACRALNRQRLDTLATRLDVEGSWDRLVASPDTDSKLRDLELRCRHRERLLDHLGPGVAATCNRGVRALFTGPSGTGKTLAAKILAAELGKDLYRVDLSAVINKYIGETEKNLHRVLSCAEELDVILLLDEGDSLLGSRTQVKSATDRYANLETNYLLQRLENYLGIVVVTTNAGEFIDRAFQRRMDILVNFRSPHARERYHIWQLHLPEDYAMDHACLEEIAIRCSLNGGQIRNAAIHATLLALNDGRGAVAPRHLLEAIRREYQKAGAICPIHDNGDPGAPGETMEAFLNALSL